MNLLTPPTTPLKGSIPVFRNNNQYFPATPLINLPLSPPLSPESLTTERADHVEPLPSQAARYQSRPLTDNELSYFLPSRSDGVNDMYVHHRLTADPALLSTTRVLHAWAYQLLRHPLLASSILPTSYEAANFCRSIPHTVEEALQQARDRFHPVYTSSSHSIIDDYLNGPRTLSAERLSCLILASPFSLSETGLLTLPQSPNPDAESDTAANYELMLCTTHSIGDGMALHTFMNELYTLLGSSRTVMDFRSMITTAVLVASPQNIPRGLSTDTNPSAWQDVVERFDYARHQGQLTGNQTLPVVPFGQRMRRRTVVPTFAYTPDETKRILGRCKSNGVTIAHAVFALCNVAWAKQAKSTRDACILYSAANLRSHLPKSSSESFFHLAIGYFNISLPCLHLPIPTSDLVWHRAKSVKSQMVKVTRSSFVASRAHKEAVERRERAVKWVKFDDGVEDLSVKIPAPIPALSQSPAAPQKALMGVSMLGNLDGMYRHAEYPDIELQSLITGSRQRSAGILLFAYTFQGQLWLSLGYDANGFVPGAIENFWEELQGLVSETMLEA